jgi:hypothetical protein
MEAMACRTHGFHDITKKGVMWNFLALEESRQRRRIGEHFVCTP